MNKFSIIFFFIITFSIFSQEDNLPVIMAEFNTGYAVGINTDSGVELGVKLMYPFLKSGVLFELGGIFTPDKPTFHFFIGPMFFIYINDAWRVPVTFGFVLLNGKTLYYGVGGIVSVHRKLTKNIYAGLNIGITYAFNNVYDEITGYKTEKVIADDGTGNAIYIDREVPIIERLDHWGSYIYIRPSLSIGLQF